MLTPREFEVLSVYARLGNMKLVGAELGISYHTVRNHFTHICNKLDVNNTTMVFWALGWLRVPA